MSFFNCIHGIKTWKSFRKKSAKLFNFSNVTCNWSIIEWKEIIENCVQLIVINSQEITLCIVDHVCESNKHFFLSEIQDLLWFATGHLGKFTKIEPVGFPVYKKRTLNRIKDPAREKKRVWVLCVVDCDQNTAMG